LTPVGWIHLSSALFLSAVICFSVSLNENRNPKRIFRETLRRWVKFLGLTVIIALAVHLMSP